MTKGEQIDNQTNMKSDKTINKTKQEQIRLLNLKKLDVGCFV